MSLEKKVVKKSIVIPMIWMLSQGAYSLLDLNSNPIFFAFGSLITLILLYPTISNPKYDIFTSFFIAFVGLLVIEIINSYFNFGQPFMISIKNCIWFLPYFLYFPISSIIQKRNNNSKIQNYFIILGFVASLISVLLYLNKGTFWHFSAQTGIRDGNFFVLFSHQMILMSTIILVGRLFGGNFKNRTIGYFLLLFQVAVFFIVMRYRGQAIGVFVGVLCAFLLTKDIKKWKKVLCVVIGFITILSTDNTIVTMISNLFEQISTGTNTIGVRLEANNFFISEWLKHPILGYGGTLLSPPYRIDYSALYKFYTSDVGIVGWLYKYGIIGIIFYAYYIYILVKGAFIKTNNSIKNNYLAIAYLSYRLSTVFSLMNIDYTYQGTLYFDIFLFSFINANYHELKNKIDFY